MAVFTYDAVDRGKLAAGHTAGTEYIFEIPLSEWTPQSRKQQRVVKSLSGTKFTTLYRIEQHYSFVTISTDDATQIANLEELFSSVAAGETFTIDVFGSIGSPDNPITVSIDGDHTIKRLNQTELQYSARVEAA